jgi:superfamily II DNA helicase RecQ
MAKFKPKNIDDLEIIYGAGKAKSKKFGEYFLKVIQNH